MELRVHRHRLRLARPLRTAAGAVSDRDLWLLALTAEGTTGWGEAAPLPGFGGGEPAATAAVLATVPARVDESGIAALSESWNRPATAAAARALEGALRDLAARRAGQPLHRHLGGTGRGVVPTATLLDEWEGRRATDDGSEATLKVKSSGDVAADLARLRRLAIRHPGCRLRLDANARWPADDARLFLDHCAGLPLDFVEQPLGADDRDGHARLAAAGLPVALDEGLAGVADPAAVAGCCAVCVVKPQWWPADPVPWIRRAVGLGLRVVISDVLGSAVGRAHAAHLAAALVPGEVHGLGTDHLVADDLADLRALHGHLRLPPEPGIGLEPRDA